MSALDEAGSRVVPVAIRHRELGVDNSDDGRPGVAIAAREGQVVLTSPLVTQSFR